MNRFWWSISPLLLWYTIVTLSRISSLRRRPTCAIGRFTCKNKKCIPKNWACDGERDCYDGSDEQNCTQPKPILGIEICDLRAFQCTNGKCIPKRWWCDNDVDCNDKSDEIGCIWSTCNSYQFMCKKTKECLPKTFQCDGDKDCADGSDERDCAIDECKNNNGGCSQICVDTPAGFYCDCNPGFIIVGSYSCKDIDECEIPGSCSQYCENTNGSFKCSCGDGYHIDSKQDHSCKVDGHEPFLIFADRKGIYGIQPSSSYKRQIMNNLTGAVALDYIYNDGIVIWSDVAQKKIFSASIDRTNYLYNVLTSFDSSATYPYNVIIKDNLQTPDGLAVDWIYMHIYWTDTGNNNIEVADLKGKNRKVLIRDGLDEPRAIVVDPRFGWMYWTDWGKTAKIERAGMDGTHRTAIITTDISWPNGLAIDYVLNRLYWVDAKIYIIASSDFDGLKRQTILSSPIYLKHPFSVSVFEDTVYWTDWESNSIQSVNKFNGKNVSSVVSNLYSPMNIHVYHEMQQPKSINYCGPINGNCTHLCLPAPQISEHSAKYTCACPDGVELTRDDRTCGRDYNFWRWDFNRKK